MKNQFSQINQKIIKCKHRQDCYEYLECLAICMGDSHDERNNISKFQAQIRAGKHVCINCQNREDNLLDKLNDEKVKTKFIS